MWWWWFNCASSLIRTKTSVTPDHSHIWREEESVTFVCSCTLLHHILFDNYYFSQAVGTCRRGKHNVYPLCQYRNVTCSVFCTAVLIILWRIYYLSKDYWNMTVQFFVFFTGYFRMHISVESHRLAAVKAGQVPNAGLLFALGIAVLFVTPNH